MMRVAAATLAVLVLACVTSPSLATTKIWIPQVQFVANGANKIVYGAPQFWGYAPVVNPITSQSAAEAANPSLTVNQPGSESIGGETVHFTQISNSDSGSKAAANFQAVVTPPWPRNIGTVRNTRSWRLKWRMRIMPGSTLVESFAACDPDCKQGGMQLAVHDTMSGVGVTLSFSDVVNLRGMTVNEGHTSPGVRKAHPGFASVFNIADIASAYHDYAIEYNEETDSVSISVDGVVLVDEDRDPHFSADMIISPTEATFRVSYGMFTSVAPGPRGIFINEWGLEYAAFDESVTSLAMLSRWCSARFEFN